MEHNELLKLKGHIQDMGFNVTIVAYLRPFLSWLESMFQQRLKYGHLPPNPFEHTLASIQDSDLNFLRRLDRLSEVFGESNLVVRPFRPSKLIDGCVVRDFLALVGISDRYTVAPRINDGLSIDAVRFLYAFTKYRSDPTWPRLWEANALIRRLQLLPSDKHRFHPSIIAPIQESLQHQSNQILQRYCVDLGDTSASQSSLLAAIRCEDDLFCYSASSLAWLEAQIGAGPIQGEGEKAARQVAAVMDQLQRHVTRNYWHQFVRERLGMTMKRLLRLR